MFIRIITFACILALLVSPLHAGYTTFLNNGPSSNRVDIVFLGDGYTASQLGTYQTHIDAMMDHLFDDNEEPFVRYANYFNAHRIDVISTQSGADDPSFNYFVNTALDARYRADGVTQHLLSVSSSKANAALNAGLLGAFVADIKLVTVNDTQYGGSGGTFATYAGGSIASTEIALHELGHSFAGLADEYGGFTNPYSGGEPSEPNVTKNSSGQKWSRWLGYNQPGIGIIGSYQGARYYDLGIYRPSQNSKMRNLFRPFDAVSREEIILDIYRKVDPLDAWLNNSLPLFDPIQLWVDPIDPHIIDTQWFVNGSLIPAATGSTTFNPIDFGFSPGTYTITSHNYDPTDWIRYNFDLLQQDISWTVTLTPEPSSATLLLLAACGLARVLPHRGRSAQSTRSQIRRGGEGRGRVRRQQRHTHSQMT